MIRAYQVEELTRQIAKLLTTSASRLVTIESCTGGGVGYFCTSLPGASSWYQGGYITYQNEEKIKLGVPPDIIKRYGAVSIECAAAMAEAALKKHSQHYILSVTGIAGPEGGSAEKPVGVVCFGWIGKGRKKTALCQFSGNREAIRLQSIVYALKGLISFISGSALNIGTRV